MQNDFINFYMSLKTIKPTQIGNDANKNIDADRFIYLRP